MTDRPHFELGFTLATSRLPCPFSYQQSQKERRGSTDSDAALIGTLHHAVAKRYNEHLVQRRSKPGQSGRTNDLGALRNFQQVFFEASGIEPGSDLAKYYWALGKQFESYKLPQGDGLWIIEERLAVDREWKPCVPVPGRDYQGTPDLGRIDEGGRTGILVDYKFGNRHVTPETAFSSKQLKTYSFLFFLHHPNLKKVSATVMCFTLHGCSQSPADFRRKDLVEEMTEWYGAKRGIVDFCWDECGEDDWPTYGHADCCNYCRLKCPALAGICGGELDA